MIDNVIKQNDDILDDEDIYEMMEEKSNDTNNDENNYQENDYINFAGNLNRGGLDEANKKVFS